MKNNVAKQQYDIEEEIFLTEVCWHYYTNEMTQGEIAKFLNVTRLRVNQAIKKAKELGIVEIHFQSPFLSRIGIQEELKEKFNLSQAIVIPANRQQYDYHVPAGYALSEFLSKELIEKDWKRIGVSWGRTLSTACKKIKRQSNQGLEIISTLGGTSSGADFSTFGIATGFAEALGANYFLIAAPIFLSEGVDRNKFLSQKIYKEHLKKFEKLDAAIMTTGDMSTKSYLISNCLPDEISASDLKKLGAVGDIVGIFLDKDGNVVSSPLEKRTIGIDIKQLEKVPERILVAAGKHKVAIIYASIKRGLVSTLITDDVTAELLIQYKP